MIDRTKYITFNRAELRALLDRTPGLDVIKALTEMDRIELADVVVIRKRDVFAPAALSSYANAIQTVVEVFQSPRALDMEHLTELSDFILGEAADAYEHQGQVPT
jgi:hypothetical protein